MPAYILNVLHVYFGIENESGATVIFRDCSFCSAPSWSFHFIGLALVELILLIKSCGKHFFQVN